MLVKNFNKPLKVANKPQIAWGNLELELALILFKPAKIEKLKNLALKQNLSLIEILAAYTPEIEFYTQLSHLTGAAFSLFPPSNLNFNPQHWRLAIASGIVRCDDARLCHAPEGKQLLLFIQQCSHDAHFAKRFILIPPLYFKKYLRLASRRLWVDHAIHSVFEQHPHLSALNQKQLRTGAELIFFMTLLSLASIYYGGGFGFVSGSIFSILFFGWLIIRVVASFYTFNTPLPKGRPKDLPPYSLILALYKEANVLPALIKALEALDYPRAQLDIKLILESDDTQTRAALDSIQTDLAYDLIIAPPEGPRTKPKALMLALPYVRGKYCVVYDAEDKPHPLQLIESVATFAEAPALMAVLQAPLVIRNHARNPITKLFAAEYAALFDLTLPMLAHFKLPLPLGGTSNHFNTAYLRAVGGWDAFNVTEDAELGLRLARFGYQAGTLRLGTSEEAPTQIYAWLKQRSRWFKGWLQTLIVHGTRPRELISRLGWLKSIVFFLMIGSAFFSSLLHPIIYIVLATHYFEINDANIPLLSMLLVSGYFLAGFLLLQGTRKGNRARPGFALLLLPFYWLMLSIAAWIALFELWRRPFHWAKTAHEGD